MSDKFTLNLKSGKDIEFKVRPFHFQNSDLRRTFDSEYPTIVALYSRRGFIYKRINVHVVENPKSYFNTEPIDNELKKVTTVLYLNSPLPSPKENALDYLDKLQHEIIEKLGVYLRIGYVG